MKKAVKARYDFLPFGEQVEYTLGRRSLIPAYNTTDTTRQKFTGQEHDEESGLDYFRARYYSSALGRFTSPDAPFIDQNRSNPQSWNLYTYVRNNPLRFTDPTGSAMYEGGPPPRTQDQDDQTEEQKKKREMERKAQDDDRDGLIWDPNKGWVDPVPVRGPTVTYKDPRGPSCIICGILGAGGAGAGAGGLGGGIGIPTIGPALGAIIVGSGSGSGHGGGNGGNDEGIESYDGMDFIDPFNVRFSQDSCSYTFDDGKHTIDDLAKGLADGSVPPNSISPIRLVRKGGVLTTLDNRRLEAFRRAGVSIPFRMATMREAVREAWKFTSKNGGTSIRVRGEPKRR
jgi:RHS repeat-associated protein